MNLLSRLGTLACLFAALLVRAEDLDWRVHLVQEVEVDGVIVESIDEMQYTGTGFTTSNATTRAGYLFCGWKTNTKQDSESGFVARDYWGRAYEQVSFGLYEPMTNTAVYISADIDSDDDGMPDGTELYWYGDLDESPDTDTDGDGITFARELDLGLNPHFADEWRAGLAIASRMPDFFKLTLRSDPEGMLFATVTNNTAPGFLVSTSRYDPRTSLFACWTQDGVEQRDDFGRALDQLAFEMPTHDVELVAFCREDENARAALYWYGDESVAPTSDTDGDGITLAEEFTTGTNPLFADEYRRGIMCASRKPQFFKLILRSDPENALFPTTTNNVAQGIVKTTSAYSPALSQFAYWTVDGARQCDEFGRALDAVSVEMPPHDVEVVAVCREDVEQREALYWYGDDSVDYTSDRDGDGLSFGEEVACGTNPLFADEWLGGIRCASRKPLFFKYTLRSEPEGELFPTVVESVCPGVIKTTDAYSPDTSLFAYWSVAGTSSRDEFGRALDFVSLEMPTNDIEVVAHCVEAPDVRESVYWYGNETTEMTSDTDGDGMSFGEEITLGTNPLFADEWCRGIDHALAAFELFTCIIRSEPEGALFETRKLNIGPGVSVNAGTCDHLATDFSFWTLNGVRQADEFGRAWDTLAFTMPPTNTEAIAVCREDEKVRDAYYWYGREMSDESDTDGDGFTFAQERFNGTNPLFADTNMFTGICHALTELLEVDLQPFEQMRGTIVGGEYEELFTSPLAENEGASTTFGANVMPLAVDFDGDGLFDLMVASQQGLKVFHNAGSVANPDFREIPTEFGDWSNLAKLMADMMRPVICGANGVFYVSDDGGEIYRFTLADGSLIETGLVGIPGILDGQLVALSANGQLVASGEKPVCTLDMPVIDGLSISFADIDCDGRTDFLASDANGHIWLYRNTSTANNLLYGRYSFVLQYKVWAGTGVGFAEGMTMSTVDWEDDGDTDVLIGTGEGKLMLLRDPKTGRPTNVRAYAGTDNVLLEWDPNSQPRIRGYNVYRTPLPDAEYLRIANQVPVPRYRDVPSVLCDYWYRITGLSRFYIAGNSTPTYYESMPTDAIFVQFRPSVWLNDTSSFTETNVEMIVSINNSMGILTDGLTMSFGYDSNVMEQVEVKTTGLTEGVALEEVEIVGGGGQRTWKISAVGGEIKTGAGMFLKLVFYVKPWCGVARTEVALNAATMKALDGRAINLDLPKIGAIEIAERRYEPAVMSVAVGSVATDTCEEFEVPVTITASETLTNFAAKVIWDDAALELRGDTNVSFDSAVPESFVLKFYAKDQHTISATEVSLSEIAAVDCHGNAIAANAATGTVLITDAHPLVPAVVSISTEDKKVDTLEEVTIPFRVNATEKLKSGSFTLAWDDDVLEFVRVEGAVRSGNVFTGEGDFSVTFLARDQHDVTKTEVSVTAASVTDINDFVIAPSVPVVANVLIHDAHPLVPAKVTMTLADVAAKTETDFEMTLAIATTEALTSLDLDIAYDTSLLTYLSGQLKFTDGVPSSVIYRFHAKENHTVDKTMVTITPKSGVDHNGLTAELPVSVVGNVVLADSNPWQPATVSLSMQGSSVDTMTDFEVHVKVTSNEKLTNFVATVGYDAAVLELKGVEGATLAGSTVKGTGSNFTLKFYAKDQHDVFKTTVSLTGVSAIDEHGLIANAIVDASADIVIHDAHPLVPAKVTMTFADVAAKTETDFEMTLAIATTEALTSLDMDIAYDTSLLTYLSGQLKFTDGVPSSVVYRFHAKENHTVDKTTVTITPKSGVDHNGLTAELPASVVGNVVLADSNPWQPATVTLSMQGSSIDTMTEFKVPVKVTSNEKLTNFVATVGYEAAVLELRGVEGATLSGSTVKGSGADFALKFYAKDQHDVFKTTISLAGASAVDEHGLVANAMADASADIVIHDAHPLVPAKVTMTLADVAAKTENDFAMTLAIATTEALTSLDMEIAYDTTLLTYLSGQLKFTDGVPSSVVYRFHAKENHTVDKTMVTITPKSGVDHNGLAAELPASVVGNVVLADTNPWQPATVSLSMQGSSVDTMTEFEVPVKVTSNEKLTNLVATVGYDSAVLELRGVEGATLAGSTVKGTGSNFTLKFYAKDQHDVFKTTVALTGASAVDEHGLVAKQIANASCAVVLHDSNPPIPALVAVKVGDASAKTRADVSVVAKVTTTKALANLSFTAKWDAAALELKSVVGATYTASGSNAAKVSVAKFSGSSKEIVLTFHAKEQHTIKKTVITLSGGTATCTERLAANVSLSGGTVLLTDSNPPVAPTMVVSALDVKAESGKPFIVNVGSESAGGLAQIVMKLEWDASLLTYVGVEESAKVESISANSRRFTFTASGTDNRYHFKFTAASISALQATSWVKVTAVTATGSNGLAAQLKTALPIKSNVLIVREVNKYDPGDINGDGKYTDADLDLLNKYIAYLNVVKTGNKQAIAAVQKYNLTGLALKAADVNRDGKVDANDVSMLAQYIAAAKEVAK